MAKIILQRQFQEISRKQYTCRRVPLAQRNAPQVGIFIAGNRLSCFV
jgi:hypothetical protein